MLLDIGLVKSTTLGQSSGSDSSSSGNCHYDSTLFWTLPYAKLFLLFGCWENWGKNEPNHQPVELCYAKSHESYCSHYEYELP